MDQPQPGPSTAPTAPTCFTKWRNPPPVTCDVRKFQVRWIDGKMGKRTYEGHKLFMGAVSDANIAKMTIDNVMETLIDEKEEIVKLATLWHPLWAEASVGPPPKQKGKRKGSKSRSKSKNNTPRTKESVAKLNMKDLGLVNYAVTGELYWVEARKHCILDFRHPVLRNDFCRAFAYWIKKRKFAQVVVYGSIDDKDWKNLELEGTPLRFIASWYLDKDLLEKLESASCRGKMWKHLPLKPWPMSPVEVINPGLGIYKDDGPLIQQLPGSGFSRQLLRWCEHSKLQFLGLMIHKSSDNKAKHRSDAHTLFHMSDFVFDFTPPPPPEPEVDISELYDTSHLMSGMQGEGHF